MLPFTWIWRLQRAGQSRRTRSAAARVSNPNPRFLRSAASLGLLGLQKKRPHSPFLCSNPLEPTRSLPPSHTQNPLPLQLISVSPILDPRRFCAISSSHSRWGLFFSLPGSALMCKNGSSLSFRTREIKGTTHYRNQQIACSILG